MIKNKKKEFQELFSTIKTICSGDVSKEDKKVLSDFLRTLRYICEFDILKKCYDNNRTFNTLVPDIETKLIELKSQIEELQGHVRTEGELSSFDEVKLRAYQISYDRYNMIKEAIISRDFERYTKEMNKNLNSARQIIAACSVSLSDVDLDLAKEFEVMGKTKTAMGIIYDIESNPDLLAELVSYYKKEKNLTGDYAESLSKDQEYLRYLNLAYENQDLLRSYMLTLRKCGTSEERREVVCQERLVRNRLTLANLNNNVMTSIRNRRQINELNAAIAKDEEDLATIKASRDLLEQLEVKIRNAGLGPILDEFNYAYRDYTGSVEQRIVDFLKVTMRKKGLNITRVEKNVKEEITSLSNAISMKDYFLNDALSKMSNYGKELVTKYHDETSKILDSVTEKRKSNTDPILSAYVLKSLMTVQKLSYKDINDIIQAYDDNGIDALVDDYENVVKSTIKSIETNLMDVYNRPEFDVHELPEMQLK